MGDMTLEEKHDHLQRLLRGAAPVVVAFSGGVDSTFLLAAAHRVLGHDACIGVTAVSESLPAEELEEAGEIARQIGAKWVTVRTSEMENPDYRENTNLRCYYCKTELFGLLQEFARENGFTTVLDGFNADDTGDWRPGGKAAKEKGVRSPLMEAGLTKQDIRDLSRSFGLSTWNKASFACLASRLPYGTEITSERLNRVAAAESILRKLGFKSFRARYHGHTARIEVGSDEIQRFSDLALAREIREKVAGAGFSTVTIDLTGFRTGSQNEAPVAASAKPEVLQIDGDRAALRQIGFPNAKTAVEGTMVRVAVRAEQFAHILREDTRGAIAAAMRQNGHTYVAVDIP